MIKSRKTMLSLLALSVLAASQVAMATPGNISFRLECPQVSTHGTEIVTNYGSVIAGPGKEKINENEFTYPLLTGVNPGAVPLNLVASGYTNASTSYDPVRGVVSCSYSSTSNPSFTLKHQLENGFNGIVTSSTAEVINIKFNTGLKS